METSYRTDEDFAKYPQVTMTSACKWNPSLYDNEHDDIFYDAHSISGDDSQYHIHLFDFHGTDVNISNPDTLDIGDILSYDDFNIHSCIRYAH